MAKMMEQRKAMQQDAKMHLKKIDGASKEIEKLKRELAVLKEKQCEDTTSAGIEKKLVTLQQSMIEVQTANNQLRLQLEAATGRDEEKTRSLAASQVENERLAQLAAKSKKELTECKEQARKNESAKDKVYNAALSKHQQDNKRLLESIETDKKAQAHALHELSDAHKRAMESEKYCQTVIQDRLREKERVLVQLGQHLETKDQELAILKVDLSDRSDDLSEIKRQFDESLNEAKDLRSERNGLEDQIGVLKGQVAVLMRSYEQAKTENAKLVSEDKEVRSQNSHATTTTTVSTETNAVGTHTHMHAYTQTERRHDDGANTTDAVTNAATDAATDMEDANVANVAEVAEAGVLSLPSNKPFDGAHTDRLHGVNEPTSPPGSTGSTADEISAFYYPAAQQFSPSHDAASVNHGGPLVDSAELSCMRAQTALQHLVEWTRRLNTTQQQQQQQQINYQQPAFVPPHASHSQYHPHHTHHPHAHPQQYQPHQSHQSHQHQPHPQYHQQAMAAASMNHIHSPSTHYSAHPHPHTHAYASSSPQFYTPPLRVSPAKRSGTAK